MTMPATSTTAIPTAPPEQLTVPATPTALRHPGCYWDVAQAAWVTWAPVPHPRPARD